MVSVIGLVLTLLQSVLDQAVHNKVADEVIQGIQAAVAALEKVRGTDVTYSQLESLRVQPKW